MRVFGVWRNGESDGFGGVGECGETWESLADAKASLLARYESGYWERDRRGRVVDVGDDGLAVPGVVNDALFPAVSRESVIELYPAWRVGGKWQVHDEFESRLFLGPRGGVRREFY